TCYFFVIYSYDLCILFFFFFFLIVFFCFFFFFSSRRRHTRWPRDWSSDVCSSDLEVKIGSKCLLASDLSRIIVQIPAKIRSNSRSEERRVGKECRSRWSPNH